MGHIARFVKWRTEKEGGVLVSLFRLMIALNLVAASCPVIVPATQDYLPIGGSELSQLGLSVVVSILVLDIRDVVHDIWRPKGLPPERRRRRSRLARYWLKLLGIVRRNGR